MGLRINLINKRRGRIRELVSDLPESDIRVNELGFNGSSLITVGVVFRTERVGEIKDGVKVGTKLIAFSSVVKRGNVVVGRNPNLLIKER